MLSSLPAAMAPSSVQRTGPNGLRGSSTTPITGRMPLLRAAFMWPWVGERVGNFRNTLGRRVRPGHLRRGRGGQYVPSIQCTAGKCAGPTRESPARRRWVQVRLSRRNRRNVSGRSGDRSRRVVGARHRHRYDSADDLRGRRRDGRSPVLPPSEAIRWELLIAGVAVRPPHCLFNFSPGLLNALCAGLRSPPRSPCVSGVPSRPGGRSSHLDSS